MITFSISLMFVDAPHRPTLPPGVHSMAEIMPAVLAAHGLAMPDDGDSVRPSLVTDATDLSDVMIACLEGALAT